ncbi:MAG: hypothetical protein ABID67_00940 [Candidatus Nealsonbacteria bacterium]
MENISQETLSFLFNPSGQVWFEMIRTVFLVISFILIVGIIYVLMKGNYLKFRFFEDMSEFLTFKPSGVRKLVKVWNKVEAKLDSGLESEYKLAVIEADSILDDVLRRMGYRGENLAERLANLTSATLPNIEKLKEAHQSRTNILHNPDQGLSLDEAKKILDIFKKSLENIQAF